jgi:two-component sensor histidine kinase
MAARSQIVSDPVVSLTLAVVGSSAGPLLLLDGDLNIVAASTSFYESFDIDCATARHRRIFDLGAGEWDLEPLRALLDAAATCDAKIATDEIDLVRPDHGVRRLAIRAERLLYFDTAHPRFVVAVNDVTDARAERRAMDDALHQNGVLMQEIRHRVANSLQVIASILLHNARRTTSDETRGHLENAHHRVMSVAELERELSASPEGAGDVNLHAYFTRLCDGIAASMIGDNGQPSLIVGGGDNEVPARVSVSLGLIGTELVINALKHAFPEGRSGTIIVNYDHRGPNWELSVHDDGVGMPTDPALIHTGLGTSIVEALAKQLEASVEIAPGHPGTRVSIAHTQVALVGDRPAEATATVAIGWPAA